MKTKQFEWSPSVANNAVGYLPLFSIPEGTGEDERIGDKIKVKSIAIRGNFANTNLIDFYIIELDRNSDAPLFTDFVNVAGGHLLVDHGKEVFHQQTATGTPLVTLNMKKYYKNGLTVTFDSAGSVITNRYLMVVKNKSGATVISRTSIEIKYTD